MIRLGLIGCGAWGRNYLSAVAETGHAEVSEIATRAWRGLIDTTLDAFIVATPPDTHEEICTELLAAGRPLMVEKPVALSLQAAENISAAASKSGAPLLVNHQHLFAPAYERLRDIVRGGDWGIRSAAGNDGPHRSYSALWDYGSHDVAMHLGLADSLDGVRCTKADRAGGSYFLDIDLGAKMDGLVHVWNDRTPKTRLLVADSANHIVTYDALAPAPLMMDGLAIDVDGEQPLQRAIRHFAEAVRTGKTDWRFGGDIGVHVTRILSDAERMTVASESIHQEAP